VRSFTIGEVLNRLKDEFDDVTISKIRFLEAEGLISPDRTESGYRKFTPADVERLRYILRAQRDRYLPLKVIKEELDRIDAGLPVDDRPPQPDPETLEILQATDEADEAPAEAAAADPTSGPAARRPSILGGDASDVQLTLSELSDASGLEVNELRDLQQHGVLGGDASFDGDDLRAAKIAAKLLADGLEARHLRMYRQFADREVALYQQLVTPLLRQRNPDSRSAAKDTLDELVELGDRLHRALLARELRALLRS
jgi:DNA-binding transcriptional MerR regulator